MTDPLSSSRQISVKTNLEGKPVVSTVSHGIDPVDIADKIKQAKIAANQPVQDRIDINNKKLLELNKLKSLIVGLQKASLDLSNKGKQFK
ncbi:MAG: hypothetical protein Q8K36_01775, partial [Alphaproteobacteria bacterium]|nr:hypothetical protein [Alphaproteobacteria bacterium]